MKNSRRKFIKKSAYASALSAIGMPVAGSSVLISKIKMDRDPGSEWIELIIALWRPQAMRMNLTRQMVVMGGVSG